MRMRDMRGFCGRGKPFESDCGARSKNRTQKSESGRA
jgi:hypothetical protein